MNCILPPELDDDVLLAYLDGYAVSEGDDASQVAAHLRQCKHCRERARRLARVQDDMTAQVYRITCPTPTELGEYHLGLLPLDQARTVAEHLDECPHCRREIAQLKDYLAALEPPPGLDLVDQVVERVRVLIARLISGPFGQPALAPAFASVRGGEQEPFIYRAEDLDVVVEVQEDIDHPDHKTILGLVVGHDVEGMWEAHLWRAGQRVETVPVDDLGNFYFHGVPPDDYELILSSPQTEIHIQELHAGNVQEG